MNCGKTHYQNKKHAKKGALNIKAKGAMTKFRVYRCPDCDGYHLTSYDAKTAKEKKDNKM